MTSTPRMEYCDMNESNDVDVCHGSDTGREPRSGGIGKFGVFGDGLLRNATQTWTCTGCEWATLDDTCAFSTNARTQYVPRIDPMLSPLPLGAWGLCLRPPQLHRDPRRGDAEHLLMGSAMVIWLIAYKNKSPGLVVLIKINALKMLSTSPLPTAPRPTNGTMLLVFLYVQ